MHIFPSGIDFSDPAVDTTRDICGNSAFPERARKQYAEAFGRGMEYASSERLLGDVMEFGTYSGFTARILAECMRDFQQQGDLHLFDSFEGFPDSVDVQDTQAFRVGRVKYWQKGGMPSPTGIVEHILARLHPVLGDRLHVHKGMFDQTMPKIVRGKKAAVVHIDCDLFVSTKYVLDALYTNYCLQDGTVLFFDDFFCNRANPNFGEQAALRVFLASQPHFQVREWFSYSWGGMAFFVHEVKATNQSMVACRPLP